jgi:enamine deaminase RidA (YjgF/YER057c/UK114 family)
MLRFLFLPCAAGLLACATPGGSTVPTSRFVNPPGLAAPRGYTHVVDVPEGRMVYVAGQVAFDAQGNVVGKGDVRVQTEQVFRNLQTALESVGCTLADVVKLNWYVRDASQVATFREVREQFLGSGPRPASTLVEIKALVRDDLLIEIDAVAAPRR